MAQIRNMDEREAERVRDLWLQMCAEAGTPLPEPSAQLILANLQQYATHQAVHCYVAEEQQVLIGFVTCSVTAPSCDAGLNGRNRGTVRTIQSKLARNSGRIGKTSCYLHTSTRSEEYSHADRYREGKPKRGEQRVFWQSLRWENDMTIYSIYSAGVV